MNLIEIVLQKFNIISKNSNYEDMNIIFRL